MSFRVSEETRNLITTKPEFCHSEHRRCEESLLLYKHKLFLRCAGVTFFEESNQRRGGCDSPAPHKRRTSVECYFCYKSGKITNLIHFVPSHCNFSSIYTSISPPVSIAMLCLPWLSACSPQTSRLIFGEHSPNPFLFDKSQFIIYLKHPSNTYIITKPSL